MTTIIDFKKSRRRRNRILIVEDDDGIRETLRLTLEFEGYDVTTASNGKVGLEMLEKMPRPRLILLDLMMPELDGWQFTEMLASNVALDKIPVAIVTAYTNQERPIKAKTVIKKPINMDVLLKVVKDYCH